jgi:hypothetical protein
MDSDTYFADSGDKAVPTVLGHTPSGNEEVSCAWVLKKEYLALYEVVGLLKRINQDKKGRQEK